MDRYKPTPNNETHINAHYKIKSKVIFVRLNIIFVDCSINKIYEVI